MLLAEPYTPTVDVRREDTVSTKVLRPSINRGLDARGDTGVPVTQAAACVTPDPLHVVVDSAMQHGAEVACTPLWRSVEESDEGSVFGSPRMAARLPGEISVPRVIFSK